MPRHNLHSEVLEASLPGKFPRLSRIRLDGGSTIVFTYSSPLNNEPIVFNVPILNVAEYPNKHSYFAFATTDNISKPVSTFLDTVQKKFDRCKLETFLEGFCDCIDDAFLEDSLEDSDEGDDYDPKHDAAASDDFDPSSDDEDVDWGGLTDPPVISHSTDKKQLRADLRAAKAAGFKVGYLEDPDSAFVVSISCRVSKLGISQDAMQMWNVSPEQFLAVLLRYPRGYRGMNQILSQPQTGPALLQMHIGLCDTYKPTVLSVPDTANPAKVHDILCPSVSESTPKSAIKSTFITEPMETLLNTRFLGFIRNRLEHGFSWTGAELYYNDAQGKKKLKANDVLLAKYRVPEEWNNSTPSFVKGDELRQTKKSSRLSLPLIAMQYALRRFVKCTEFCLTCHCKIDAGYEALKPYVCSKPLCLYQYMQLGMGPRLEWEITSQPYVVDMLVSFAYARAWAGKLSDFPQGLDLKVPWGAPMSRGTKPRNATLDPDKMTLSIRARHDLKVGEWVAIKAGNDSFSSINTPSLSCTVLSTQNNLIQLSQPISTGFGDQSNHRQWEKVQFMPYRANFDDLSAQLKQHAVTALLDTLPDVILMKSFITSGPRPEQNKPLASWTERICPSALSVLRWIVASNQSCIVHDDDPNYQVTGMGNYMQFRLAQGSPDKEARFIQAVKSSPAKQFPTIFAWHGSPVYNWHSIVRQGLNFDEMLHGRSMGNGVYMAKTMAESQGYTASNTSVANWPQSLLGIRSAVSLNEVVNSPQSFVCCNPCYVVSQLDWIQPRYLFISGEDLPSQGGKKSKPSKVYEQDPQHTPMGISHTPVSIPISALSSREKKTNKQAPTRASKKRKVSPNSGSKTSDTSDDCDSVATLADDLRLLQSDSENEAAEPDRAVVKRKTRADSKPKTDFRPGTLQTSSLKLLGAPSYATTTATQSLQRHLKDVLKVQDREPLHELGWYVDPTLVNTVYQWIVEFHSFDPSLPLAQDLKQNELTSIVMEIRFPPEFPHSPPFFRVIRPHFVPFMNGGGGHVTIGGAMCMELLTSSGWMPTLSMESVLLQVRLALCSVDPRPARLDNVGDYNFGESVIAYRRACQSHGWRVPEDFNRIEQA
ncbi:ubiquitin conjugating enzyme [Aspergillus sclerotioniger CBS 115572]|uniref:Ubiquitin conjugating enzyme n=1 Tax=Aspergillus sclerotioniger CBS 115572 TaxID=1450535 RepID=A0A317XDY0_9EURO|nr:ubiquitin conjugating enzyme [Aspergillus sclerotioniger CBS 115572]PWY96703.1 ubiquitin conjugating enzyme [Aspergillus sclerotioniger CBS 115572]